MRWLFSNSVKQSTHSKHPMTKASQLVTGAMLLSLNSCTVPLLSEPDQPPDFIPANIMAIPNATPRFEPRTRAGNPPEYEVLGKRYRTLGHSHNYQALGGLEMALRMGAFIATV